MRLDGAVFNPTQLDEMMERVPCPARVVDGTWDASTCQCRLRVFGDAGFTLFVLKNQGYATVLEEVPLS